MEERGSELTAGSSAGKATFGSMSAGSWEVCVGYRFRFSPQNTFKGRKNRSSCRLAQTLATFFRAMRFPGGCVADGNGLDNIYQLEKLDRSFGTPLSP